MERLERHVEYLHTNTMTWENREEYYEEYGYVLSILEDTSFDSSNLYHTFTKEIEFGRAAETREEFMKPYIQSYLPVVKGEMLDVLDFISSQRESLEKDHLAI